VKGRMAFWLIYVALVATGAYHIFLRNERDLVNRWFLPAENVGAVAARAMPRNHRLAEGDVVRPDLPRSIEIEIPAVVGRYLARGVARGEIVRREVTRDEPLVAPPLGTTLVAIALGAAGTRGGAIDVHRAITIVAGTNVVDGEVVAVWPDRALIAVPLAQGLVLAKAEAVRMPLSILAR
jgi:hypothetical protein